MEFATELGGENGLALLKTLEELGYTAEDKKAYQETKLTMLFQAGPLPVEPSLFSGIEKSRLLDLAESWAQVAVSYIESQDNESEGYDIKPVVALLDHLKQDKAYHNQVAILEKILSPLPSPAPTRTVDLTEFGEKYWDFLSVSPDGRHILYNEGGEEETTYWYNIIQKSMWQHFPSSQLLFGTPTATTSPFIPSEIVVSSSSFEVTAPRLFLSRPKKKLLIYLAGMLTSYTFTDQWKTNSSSKQ